MKLDDSKGSSGCFSFLLVLLIVAAIYGAVKFLPVYMENNQVKKILKDAAFKWSNGMDDGQIRLDIRNELLLKGVRNVTVGDIDFSSQTPWKMLMTADYEVEVTHPFISPTVLKFHEEALGERKYE